MKKITFNKPEDSVDVNNLCQGDIIIALFNGMPYKATASEKNRFFASVLEGANIGLCGSANYLPELLRRVKDISEVRVFDSSEEYKEWLLECLENNKFKF